MTPLAGNLIGNRVATVVLAAWEKIVDVPLARQVLAGQVAIDLTTDTGGFVRAAGS